jgi:hypothetical protein
MNVSLLLILTNYNDFHNTCDCFAPIYINYMYVVKFNLMLNEKRREWKVRGT